MMVVHGRNTQARDSMFDFLRALELHPIEWEEAVQTAGGGSPYTGDVARAAIKAAGAVIVLMTGDDVARLRGELVKETDGPEERELTPQVRPNVMIEFGMALMADPAKTIIVELEPTRGISDVWGRNSVRYSMGDAAFRDALATRLKNCGCEVNRTGSWLRAGDFAGSLLARFQVSRESREAKEKRLDRARAKEVLGLAINRLEDQDQSFGRLRLLRLEEIDGDMRIYLSGGRNDSVLEHHLPALEQTMREISGVPLSLRFRRDMLR